MKPTDTQISPPTEATFPSRVIIAEKMWKKKCIIINAEFKNKSIMLMESGGISSRLQFSFWWKAKEYHRGYNFPFAYVVIPPTEFRLNQNKKEMCFFCLWSYEPNKNSFETRSKRNVFLFVYEVINQTVFRLAHNQKEGQYDHIPVKSIVFRVQQVTERNSENKSNFY